MNRRFDFFRLGKAVLLLAAMAVGSIGMTRHAAAQEYELTFTGTYEIDDFTGEGLFGVFESESQFEYKMVIDPSLDTNTEFFDVGDLIGDNQWEARHQWHGYSASCIVSLEVTFGNKTFEIDDLAARSLGANITADFWLDVDVSSGAKPTLCWMYFFDNDGSVSIGGAAADSQYVDMISRSFIDDNDTFSSGFGSSLDIGMRLLGKPLFELTFTGTYDINDVFGSGEGLFGVTGTTAPFEYKLIIDPSLDTNTEYYAVGDMIQSWETTHEWHGYSRSCIVAMQARFGNKTFDVSSLADRLVSSDSGAPIWLDVDLMSGESPTLSWMYLSDSDGSLSIGGASAGTEFVDMNSNSNCSDDDTFVYGTSTEMTISTRTFTGPVYELKFNGTYEVNDFSGGGLFGQTESTLPYEHTLIIAPALDTNTEFLGIGEMVSGFETRTEWHGYSNSCVLVQDTTIGNKSFAPGDIIPRFLDANTQAHIWMDADMVTNTPTLIWMFMSDGDGDLSIGAAIGGNPYVDMILRSQAADSNTFASAEDLEMTMTVRNLTQQVVSPDSYELTRGTYMSGAESELAESDNSDLVLCRATNDVQARTEFLVKGTSARMNPDCITFTLEGKVFARTEVRQTIELYNFELGVWELLDDTEADPNADSVRTVTITENAANFVDQSNGCVEARVRYESTNRRQSFASHTDQAVWMID